MGYYTRIELVDVKIKRGRGAALKRYIKEHRDEKQGFHPYFTFVTIESGFLTWNAINESGKWHKIDEFARWLAGYSEAGGKVIIHSEECDGVIWGWEFDGQGRMRHLSLQPDGPWTEC